MKRRIANGNVAILNPQGPTSSRQYASLPASPALNNTKSLQRHENKTNNVFRTLETMEEQADLAAQNGQSRWMIPYADLLTLLLGMFLAISFAPASAQHHPTSPAQILQQAALNQSKVADIQTEKAEPLNQVESRLRQIAKLPGMELRRQENGLILSLKDNILFQPGQAELSPAACQMLDQVATQITDALGNKETPIRIEGHTDNTPIATTKYPSNWELSTARATNIVRYLIKSRHFSPDALSAVGYGEFHPLADNSSIEGKRKNRRVDIVILKRKDSSPHGQTN
jgi:chemotaxis protein MotB